MSAVGCNKCDKWHMVCSFNYRKLKTQTQTGGERSMTAYKIKYDDQTSANGTNKREAVYNKLFYRFIIYTMICSVIPLLIVGWSINVHYTNFAGNKMIESFENQINNHKNNIQLFLEERKSKLFLIANTHTPEDLTIDGKLNELFEIINHGNWSFTDLGVIDDKGKHLAYVGPYHLIDKNYAETTWFKEVMKKGLYISDMFLGFRQEPHFVIAVKANSGSGDWILRATIDTEYFRSLVENVKIGRTGEVYLVNKEGLFQTTPRFGGEIMGKAQFPLPQVHNDVIVREVQGEATENNEKQFAAIVAETWLSEPEWLLMVRQDYSEAFNSVNHANKASLLFLHITAGAILIVTIFITRHMIKIIKKRDAETDQLNMQLLQAGKLAAIGELSAGVAHEINNPLAIILTETQILTDAYQASLQIPDDMIEQFDASTSQIEIQVQRCKRITQNLLRFARRTESVIESMDINQFLQEIVDLMEREARSIGISFETDFHEKLPLIKSDPSQLQQVFLNLITNAIDAHNGKSSGKITLSTKTNPNKETIQIDVADNGCGIPPHCLQNIFDPFFTTKPVGKGTGLGLSICYSSIQRLGGEITVTSELNVGTTFSIKLPLSQDETKQQQN